jgi:hypothetical protein
MSINHTKKQYYDFVENRQPPKKPHDTLESAEAEAKRLAGLFPAVVISIMQIVKQYKGEIIVKEVI